MPKRTCFFSGPESAQSSRDDQVESNKSIYIIETIYMGHITNVTHSVSKHIKTNLSATSRALHNKHNFSQGVENTVNGHSRLDLVRKSENHHKDVMCSKKSLTSTSMYRSWVQNWIAKFPEWTKRILIETVTKMLLTTETNFEKEAKLNRVCQLVFLIMEKKKNIENPMRIWSVNNYSYRTHLEINKISSVATKTSYTAYGEMLAGETPNGNLLISSRPLNRDNHPEITPHWKKWHWFSQKSQTLGTYELWFGWPISEISFEDRNSSCHKRGSGCLLRPRTSEDKKRSTTWKPTRLKAKRKPLWRKSSSSA